MAILSFNEAFKIRGGQGLESGRTITREFKVETQGSVSDFLAIYSHGNMPTIGAAFPGTQNLAVNNQEITSTSDDGCHFKVEVTYAPATFGGIEGSNPERPWEAPPIIEYDFHPVRVNVDSCFHAWVGGGAPNEVQKEDGTAPIRNSAKVPFSEGLVDEDYLMSISISRAERSISARDLTEFQGSINESTITVAGQTIQKHQGRIRKFKARQAYTPEGVFYYDVLYEILINFKTHLHIILDTGLVKLTNNGYSAITTEDISENVPNEIEDIAEPWPLDGTGGPVRPYDTDFVFAKFRVARETNWSNLALPVNMR